MGCLLRGFFSLVFLLLFLASGALWFWSSTERDDLGWTTWVSAGDGGPERFESFVGLISGGGEIALDVRRHDEVLGLSASPARRIDFGLNRREAAAAQEIVPVGAQERHGFFRYVQTDARRPYRGRTRTCDWACRSGR